MRPSPDDNVHLLRRGADLLAREYGHEGWQRAVTQLGYAGSSTGPQRPSAFGLPAELDRRVQAFYSFGHAASIHLYGVLVRVRPEEIVGDALTEARAAVGRAFLRRAGHFVMLFTVDWQTVEVAALRAQSGSDGVGVSWTRVTVPTEASWEDVARGLRARPDEDPYEFMDALAAHLASLQRGAPPTPRPEPWQLLPEAFNAAYEDEILAEVERLRHVPGWRVSYAYQNPGRAGPFKGHAVLPQKPSYRKGDTVRMPFGAATVTSIGRTQKWIFLEKPDPVEVAAALHRQAVVDAAGRGQPVPAAVLAAYPDLAVPHAVGATEAAPPPPALPPPFERDYLVVDFSPVLAAAYGSHGGDLGALAWVDLGRHRLVPSKPYGAVVRGFGAPRGTLLGFFRTRDQAADFNTAHQENAPFECPPGVPPFAPGTDAAERWTGPLWMHATLRAGLAEQGYPLLPGAPMRDPLRIYRSLRGVLDAGLQDPAARAVALVRAWLDAQGYYPPAPGTPGVTRFQRGDEGWVPLTPTRYLDDGARPLPEAFGRVYVVLRADGRVRGFRWVQTEKPLRPALEEVLNASLGALADLLAHETRARGVTDAYAQTREYQRQYVAHQTDAQLDALLRQPSTAADPALRALAREEAGRRRVQAAPGYLDALAAVWGVGAGASRLLPPPAPPPPPPPPAPPPPVVRMAEVADPTLGSWGLAVDAAEGATLYRFEGDGWRPHAVGAWTSAGPTWRDPLDADAARVLPALLAEFGVEAAPPSELYAWAARVLPEAERALGVRVLRPPLGSGSYGHVFALAGDPTRVLKLTVDRREVAGWTLVAAARVAGWPLPGFARLDQGPSPVGKVGPIDAVDGDVIAHAYVREAVEPLSDDVLARLPRHRLDKRDGYAVAPDDAPRVSSLAAASESARRWAETSSPMARDRILARYRHWLQTFAAETRQTEALPAAWKPFDALVEGLLWFADQRPALPLDVEHPGNVGRTARGAYVAYDFGVPFPRPLALRRPDERKGKAAVEPHAARVLHDLLKLFGAA